MYLFLFALGATSIGGTLALSALFYSSKKSSAAKNARINPSHCVSRRSVPSRDVARAPRVVETSAPSASEPTATPFVFCAFDE